MADVKISLIGAGSAAFSLRLVGDLAATRGLEGCTFCFMDVDETRLDAVHSMARKYLDRVGMKVKLEKTTSREEAIRGADFVINTALSGGHSEQEAMREVGEAHGYYRGVDAVEFNMVQDYLTIGGYNQMKLALELARDTHDLAPGAWFLEVSNPMFEVCTLIGRESGLKKFAGYCHGYREFGTMVSTLGLKMEDVDYQVAGFNHNIFLTRFRHKGEDGYPLIDAWLEQKGEKFWETFYSDFDFQMSRAGADMYKLYGVYPVGDTVRSGSWKYHYDLETKQRWYGANGGFDSELGWAHYLAELEMRTAQVGALAGRSPDDIVREFPPTGRHEDVLPFIDAVANGNRQRVVLNVPNKGSVPSVPDDAAAEVSCIVDSAGVHPEKADAVPNRLLDSLLVPRLSRMEWVLDALLNGSREMLVEIVIRDRRTTSERQARETVDALLGLPFNAEARAHYR